MIQFSCFTDSERAFVGFYQLSFSFIKRDFSKAAAKQVEGCPQC